MTESLERFETMTRIRKNHHETRFLIDFVTQLIDQSSDQKLSGLGLRLIKITLPTRIICLRPCPLSYPSTSLQMSDLMKWT